MVDLSLSLQPNPTKSLTSSMYQLITLPDVNNVCKHEYLTEKLQNCMYRNRGASCKHPDQTQVTDHTDTKTLVPCCFDCT
jgi:hypothetical protein